jgi:hypothetical protein
LALHCCRTVAAASYLASASEALKTLDAEKSSSSSSSSLSADAMYFNDELQYMTKVVDDVRWCLRCDCRGNHMTQEVLQAPMIGCFLTNRHAPKLNCSLF